MTTFFNPLIYKDKLFFSLKKCGSQEELESKLKSNFFETAQLTQIGLSQAVKILLEKTLQQ